MWLWHMGMPVPPRWYPPGPGVRSPSQCPPSGLTPEDLEVSLDGDKLTVRGQVRPVGRPFGHPVKIGRAPMARRILKGEAKGTSAPGNGLSGRRGIALYFFSERRD